MGDRHRSGPNTALTTTKLSPGKIFVPVDSTRQYIARGGKERLLIPLTCASFVCGGGGERGGRGREECKGVDMDLCGGGG